MKSMQENIWVKRVRFLTQALIISVSLNVALFSTFVYFSMSRSHSFMGVNQKISTKSREFLLPTSAEVFWEYMNASHDRLLQQLGNREYIENGYNRRDLALSCLVSFHHFDLPRALAGHPLEQRELAFIHSEGGERIELKLFPGLSEDQYQTILHFAKSEKWPLTPEGLFYELKRSEPTRSLKEAFFTTPFYQVIFTLLGRSEPHMYQEEFLEMISFGSWDFLSQFMENPTNLIDFSKEKKLAFLAHFALSGSQIAAKCIMQTDRDYVIRRFNDEELITFIPLLCQQPEASIDLLKELLYGVRSDSVRHLAGKRLYFLSGEISPEPYHHDTAMKRFITGLNLEPKWISPISTRVKKHRVQPGESLWKIARIYQVDVEDLRKINNLEPESYLSVGKELEIPHKRGS